MPPAPPIAASAPPAVRLDGAPVPAPAAVRTDVAAFVGRVEWGLVTAVESAEEFAAAFREAPDSRLGPAVRAFFRNGGRRCWVIPADPPFLDERLASFGVATLLREASMMDHPAVHLCSLPRNPAPAGVHAVLAIEEVTLLAVPDAFPPRPAPAAPGTDPAPGGGGTGGTTETGTAPIFSTCKVPNPAVLELDFALTPKTFPDPPPPTVPLLRSWKEASWGWKTSSTDPAGKAEEDQARAGARFTLERSESGTFLPNETEAIYRGTGFAASVGPEPASYRVRAETDTLTGAWASQAATVPTAHPVPGHEDPLATQIAAAKVCAARGDVLAVLTPPEDWPAGDRDWVEKLAKDETHWTPEDSHALRTHAAFWGPWVLARDAPEKADTQPEAFPADGAVCGLLARRAVERGPWASVLNFPVAGALGLGPAPYGPGEFVPLFAAEPSGSPKEPESRKRVTADQATGVNRLARTARGFAPVGERTAWPDSKTDAVNGLVPEVVPVRRLMALLRREMLRVGVDLAFAPNGPALERRAVRAVEAVLERLLRGGALAGPDARSSFQVTAQAGDPDTDYASRIEIEVRVRSALPLRVLTIRLIRSDEGAFTVAEGSL